MHFLVLSSSRGTTFQAIIDAIKEGTLTARCLGLVSDKPNRGCVEKANIASIPVRIVERGEEESRENYDKRIEASIQELLHPTPDALPPTPNVVIAAIGWMHILSPWFIHQHKNRILNVHPALLPKFGGKGMYGAKVHEAVLKSGDKESGMTIHLMDEEVDTGPILLQKNCPVLPDDTPESLQVRVQKLEKEWYPKVLQMIERGEMKLPQKRIERF